MMVLVVNGEVGMGSFDPPDLHTPRWCYLVGKIRPSSFLQVLGSNKFACWLRFLQIWYKTRERPFDVGLQGFGLRASALGF